MYDKREDELSVIWKHKEQRQPVGKKNQQKRQQLRRCRRRRVRRIRFMIRLLAIVFLLLCMVGLWKLGCLIWEWAAHSDTQTGIQAVMQQFEWEAEHENPMPKPAVQEDFLTPNEYSRPQERLLLVDELFVHYTANAGTSAAQNRSYFENLGLTGETSASAHFVIGYEGEIIQCLPLEEIGYAVKEHNYRSVSIECCYLEEDGSFTDATYQSLIELLGWLMGEYELDVSAVKRHYDASGKLCPLYYAENEDAWEKLLEELEEYTEKL